LDVLRRTSPVGQPHFRTTIQDQVVRKAGTLCAAFPAVTARIADERISAQACVSEATSPHAVASVRA
jgi:hypothetical protein